MLASWLDIVFALASTGGSAALGSRRRLVRGTIQQKMPRPQSRFSFQSQAIHPFKIRPWLSLGCNCQAEARNLPAAVGSQGLRLGTSKHKLGVKWQDQIPGRQK